MKLFSYIVTVLTALIVNSQPNYKLTIEGYFEQVIELPNEEISAYSETKKWLQSRYNNPDNVLKGDIENEYLRIDALSLEKIGTPQIDYQLELDFKEGKYRIRYTIKNLKVQNYSFKTKGYFKPDGTLRKANEKKAKRVEEEVIALLADHYNYLTESLKSNDDW